LIAGKLVLIVFLFGSLATTAADSPSPAGESRRRHDLYIRLSEQIYPVSLNDGQSHPEFKFPSAEKIGQIRLQLHDLMREEIGSALANGAASPDQLRKAMIALQEKSSLGEMGGNLPFVQSLELDGVPTLAVGYSVAFGGLAIPASDPWLEFYQKINGIWTFKAQSPIDAAFYGSSFFIAPLAPGVDGQAWFLTWRETFGDTGARLRLRLFAFDGTRAGRIWSENERIAGKVSVSKSSVELSFDKEYHSRYRVEEVLEVVPTGLRVASRKTAFH